MQFSTLSLVSSEYTTRDARLRWAVFGAWLLMVAWLWSKHVFWRDEVRAYSLALSGSNFSEMLRNIHGEGHPALWYLILRGAHDVFPYREVLPAAAAVIGVAAMAIFTFRSPFRLPILALCLFSLWGAFEYVVMARNYGVSALVMFSLAALYPRVRSSLWFGLILAMLCNTNVPSCFLAAGYLLFRFGEMLADRGAPERRDWLVFAGNAALAAVGALLCFVTVYPTPNDAAVSHNLADLSVTNVARALVETTSGFASAGLEPFLLAPSCLGLVRRPAALIASLAALVGLKLFFYFVYLSSYRHEALYLVFLLSLYWMAAKGAGGSWQKGRWMRHLQLVGTAVFVAVLLLQSVLLVAVPVVQRVAGAPFSRSAQVGQLLQRPELSGAIVMGDPDTMLEALPYYAGNPLWFLRQQRFGRVVRLTENARRELSLADVLADAQRLHDATGRPVVFLSHVRLQDRYPVNARAMFDYVTVLRPEEVRRFEASTRLVASLRPAGSDEAYDVYVYPR
jgi:hypothetical protein